MIDSKTDILERVKQGNLPVERAIALLKAIKSERQSSGQGGDRDLQALYFTPTWSRQSTADRDLDTLFNQNETVLLLDRGERRFEALQQTSWFRSCVLVKFGSAYRKERSDRYQVNPRSPQDFERLVSELQSDGLLPTYVLHYSSSSLLDEQANSETLQDELNNGIVPLFLLSQSLLQTKLAHRVEIVSIYGSDTATVTAGTIPSFGRVANLECPQLRYRTIWLNSTYPNPKLELQAILSATSQATRPVEELRIGSAGGYWRQSLQEMEIPERAFPSPPTPLVRQGGVYLITGGMGGLGLIVARHLARYERVRLILIGRSPRSDRHLNAIRELEKSGAEATYFSADITQQHQIEAAIQSARSKYGAINGVIHAAGIIEDKLIRNKELSSFERVLAPKVLGTVILDRLTRADKLDFFITFSSIGSLLPQIGQADYAAANRFMDDFVTRRQTLVEKGRRSGQSLSINWPLWEDGNMTMLAEQRQLLKHQTGLVALSTKEGLTQLETALTFKQPRVLILYGQSEKIRQTPATIFEPSQTAEPSAGTGNQQLDIEILKQKLATYLLNLVAETSKVPRHRIDPNADLETIGLDSILVNRINLRLEAAFDRLPKTLLYEYQSVHALANYLIANHLHAISSMFGNEALVDETSIESASSREILRPVEKSNHGSPKTRDRQTAFSERSDAILPETSPAISDLQFQVPSNDIAIVGIHGRYPQSPDLEQLWENLKSGRNCIATIPRERWDGDLFFDSDRQRKGRSYGKWGGFLEDVDRFDPLFFNISPREAETMDPQERLFLEVAWSALEDAGSTRQTLRATGGESKPRVGVFVGVSSGHYQLFSIEGWSNGQFQPAYSSLWSIANRVSYILNLNGPSLAIDTACSSSLTAIHLACNSLQKGECAYAIAGGVNLNLHPSKYLALSDMQFLSSDDRCRSFGEGGDGYVPGEGVGAVILKPLKQAIEDGDRIYAAIKGTAVNHGGKTNGYTVPNPQAQADLIWQAFDRSGIDPQTVTYIETHGTGTSLGDPIEIAGLSKVFNGTQKLQYCGIGSIKSNIGHLEPAAGIASLTKVVLQLQHQTLVPSLHASQLNPNIDFASSPFYVCQDLKFWDLPVVETAEGTHQTYPRRAAISSFGAGGSNAHIIVEEFNSHPVRSRESEPGLAPAEMIVLSARDPKGLRTQVEQLLAYLQNHSPCLSDLAYTLQVGREGFEARLGLIVQSQQELIEKLSGFLQNRSDSSTFYGTKVKVNAGFQNQQIALQLWQEKRWTELLDSWTAGENVPWETFYNPGDRQRISLPTYPFNRQRFWVPAGYDLPFQPPQCNQALHPLIDRALPSFDGAVFAKVLKSDDTLIAEHRVKGAGFLPGVAHLEMVRAANEMTTGRPIIRFENVVWISPIEVSSERPIRLTLERKSQNQMNYPAVKTDGVSNTRSDLQLDF